MTAIRIALNELRRLSAGKLPKLAILALVLVPLLYASFYLYANFDPYSRLDKLPAAVVVSDQGSDGRNVGREVGDELLKSGTFQWHEVSAEEAKAGVRDDKYSFAIGIPAGFSQALLGVGTFQPQQATVTLTTNDANNYLSGTIAKQVAEQVRKTIAEKVGSEAADRFLVGFSTIYGKIAEAATGANKLADGLGQLKTGQAQLSDGASQLAAGLGQLSPGLNTLRDKTKDLPSQASKLADGASQVAAGNAKIASTAAVVASASADLQSNLNSINGSLATKLRADGLTEEQVQQVLSALGTLRAPVDSANTKIQDANSQVAQLASGSKQVADGAAQLAAAAPQLASGISQAADAGVQLNEGATKLADGEKKSLDATNQLADGSAQLRDGLNEGLKQIPNPDDPTRSATANTIADPVAINSASAASAGTYGAGLAPFFISLATWIGAFVLFLLLRPLATRALTAGASPFRVALGGWLSSAVLGTAQVTVLFGAVTWLVGIHIAHPLGAIGFAILVSLTFTAVVHALNAFFGAVGKFLGLVLLVLQLVSAGGTFPWQTIPDALYPLHIVLPMGYAIDGFRHLMYTGASTKIIGDIAVLLAYLVGALLVSTLAARKRRTWTVSALKPELSL